MAETLTPDLCVIGGGTGGLAAAETALALGASVVVVERNLREGDGLRALTLASKALVAAATRAQALRTAGAFGTAASEPRVNMRRVHDHVRGVVAEAAPEFSAARFEGLGARVLEAEGRFVDPRTLAVGEDRIRAKRFIIATGARAVVPAIEGLAGVPYFTGETIFDNTRKLTHLVIIGAGPMGVELAQAYRRLGSAVTLVDRRRPLALHDPELTEIALRRLVDEGVRIVGDAEVTRIQGRSMGIGVVVATAEGVETIDASHILVAAGREPNLEPLGLEVAGIRTAPDDPIRLAVDPGLRTSNRQVYAIGDAAGGPQQAHLAAWQAGIAVRNALFGGRLRNDPGQVPTVLHTDPELAEIGLSEAAARARHGDDVVVLRRAFAENDRARLSHEAMGVAKIVTSRSGRLLGAGIAGAGAGEIIGYFALAIAKGFAAADLAGFVAPEPTLSAIVTGLGADVVRETRAKSGQRGWLPVNRIRR